MKLLRGPYGWSGYGTAISLRCRNTVDGPALCHVIALFSSYEPAHRKIVAALRHSGRYDCFVQAAWFKHQHAQLGRMLADLGVDLVWHGSTL
jgi:hypothetical protein